MAPPSSAWLRMAPHGSAWLRMASHGSAWLRMAPHGSAWLRMAPHGSAWLRMAPHGLQSLAVWRKLAFARLAPLAFARRMASIRKKLAFAKSVLSLA